MLLGVNAHPGKTDGSGGHTDHNTGEYHYHHGYPEHDHYDMDGDGSIDCPYDFQDKTDHSSDGNNSSDADLGISLPPTTNSETDYQGSGNHHGKSEGNIYSYLSLGFIIAFFIFVNCWAIHIDRTDTSQSDEPISQSSAFISVLSTIIVFALLFCIMWLFKRPLTWREISFNEMLQILLFSAIFGGIVWVFSNWASLCIDALLCKLFNTEVHGELGAFQRITIPLSYAFMVLLFILQ